MLFQARGVRSARWCVVGVAALAAVLSTAGGFGRAAAQNMPWKFEPGAAIDPELVLTPVANSGPSITNLKTAAGYNALLTYYNEDVNGKPGLLYSLETGVQPQANFTGPQSVPLAGSSYPLIPESGAGLTTIPEGVFAAWSTDATNGVSHPDYYAYTTFQGSTWLPTTAVGCDIESSPNSHVQPAAAWSPALPTSVNVYTESSDKLFAADGINYNGKVCQSSQAMANAPPGTGVGAAFDPKANGNNGAFVVFTCSSDKVAWVVDGGMSKVTDLGCTSDTTIAAVYVQAIPKSTFSGIVFFYKYQGLVYYGYLVSNTDQVYPAGPVGFSTGLDLASRPGGPGAVYFDSKYMLVVYQGEDAGVIYSGWGTPQ